MNGSGQRFFFAGKKFTNFDTLPKGFVVLVPSFWSGPVWKSAIYMPRDVAVLEQVCYRTSLLTSKLFAHSFYIWHFFSSKTFERTLRSPTNDAGSIPHLKLRVMQGTSPRARRPKMTTLLPLNTMSNNPNLRLICRPGTHPRYYCTDG